MVQFKILLATIIIVLVLVGLVLSKENLFSHKRVYFLCFAIATASLIIC